jgi:hypothetical protein
MISSAMLNEEKAPPLFSITSACVCIGVVLHRYYVCLLKAEKRKRAV